MDLNDLYELAEKEKIDIEKYNGIDYLAISVDVDGAYAIGVTDAMYY